MKVLDFNLHSLINGGRITAFNYSRSLNELVGSWSAEVAGGSFKAGNNISFSGVLTDGFIASAFKDKEGLWHIEGKDAGIKLMRSTPEISELPEGNAKAVISHIADYCGITLVMNSVGLSGFNVRSIISGSTCAEAVLELSMLSGYIAFIDNDGKLNVTVPASKDNSPAFDNIIDDSGSDIDLDGYATQVFVTLNRRKDDDKGEGTFYTGTTPSLSPTREKFSGTFLGGRYSLTVLEPFGVTEKAECTFTKDNVTVSTTEEHDYKYKAKTAWRDNQEYALFAFYERGYTLTTAAEGSYLTADGETLSFKETTTETMSRNLSLQDAIGVPDEWDGELDMVNSETITRSTVREGGKEISDNMPAYSPPYDSKITRSYSREHFGRGLICNEVESRYEARQVGTVSPIKQNGELIPHFLLGSALAIQTHSSPEWVEIITLRTYYDRYDDEGNCVLSTRSEWSDDGAQWLTAHALSSTGDDDLDDYQKAYAKFSQQSHGLSISFGTASISGAWQFVELQGRMKNSYADDAEGIVLGNVSDWYDNGQYVKSYTCPHYNTTDKTCNIYMLPPESRKIPKSCLHYQGRLGWTSCKRALKALDMAREQDTSQLFPTVIGSASINTSNTSLAVYRREIYVDDIISDTLAQSIADIAAKNILAVKGTKGIRKTLTIPYDPSILPDGCIVEVSHDWAELTTSVTFLQNGDIPEFLISQSVAGVAFLVSARENSRQNFSRYGSVISTEGNNYTVKIGTASVLCSTKMKNISTGDIVLVSFPSGNRLRGQIIARL